MGPSAFSAYLSFLRGSSGCRVTTTDAGLGVSIGQLITQCT